MSRGPDAATLLERALLASAAAAGCPVAIARSGWEHWASATFAGARHEILLSATDGAALRAWLAALPEAEFALRGHLVADLAVAALHCDGGEATARIEALTVEAR